MSALHEAARLVVAAWSSTRHTWVEECNEAVLALDAALKAQAEPAQQDEPAQEHGPVAAAFSAAFGAEQRPTDERVVIERRGETLYLNGREIGPGTLEIRRDGATYRSAERVAVQPEPLSDREIDALFHDWNSRCHGDPVESHRRFARVIERKVRGEEK